MNHFSANPIVRQTSRVLSVLLVLSLLLSALPLTGLAPFRVEPVHAAGTLDVTIIAGYNLVVDSNAMSPSTYAPKVATVMGRFCNTGTDPLTDVFGYIGDGTTAGTYPVKTGPTVGTKTYAGSYSFRHLGGAADASRRIGDLAAGECKVQYWHFEYPHCQNDGDGAWDDPPCAVGPTWGDSVKPDDDLYLDFTIWGQGMEGATPRTDSETWTMTMRNEISAMANKIKPNPDGEWYNTDSDTVLPGDIITTNGIKYELGNVRFGFDNDGNYSPDYNAWLQPFGNTDFDPSCFRLIHTEGTITVSRGGHGDLVIPFDDKDPPDPDYGGPLYFTNLPDDNTGVTGNVYYTFLALGGACTAPLSPYQEVASGYDNEKFNGDYGTGIPPSRSYEPAVTINKTGPNSATAGGASFTYSIPFANTSDTTEAGLTLSSGDDVDMPLVVEDTVPDGLEYICGSAASGNTLDYTPGTAPGYEIFYSTDSGSTWSATEPSSCPVTSSGPNNLMMIQWWLTDPLPTHGASGNNGAGTFTFQAQVPGAYSSPTVENCAKGRFDNGKAFAEACKTTIVAGNNSIGDKVWDDANTNGLDDSEAGLVDVDLTLYLDANNDGVLDSTDPEIATTTTVAGGAYLFDNLPDAKYIVVVDDSDPDLPTGYRPTNPSSGQIAVDLNDAGDLNVTTADFGLGPALALTKTSLSSVPTASNGTISYKIELINNMPGDGTSQRTCQYTFWGESVDSAISGASGGGAAWNNETAATYSPDTTYAIAPLQGNSELLGISGFSSGDKGTINKVELLLPIDVIGTIAGTFDVDAVDYSTGNNPVAIINGADISTYSDGTLATTICDTVLACSTAPFGVWSDYGGTVKSILMEVKKSANPPGDFGVDAVGLRVTADGTCGDPSTDITYLPLVDTYDSSVLEYVSASVSPDSVAAGTLTWNNLGTLYAGGTREIYVTFRVLTSAGTGTDNTATSTGSKFGDGKPANTPVSDTEPIKGIVGDRLWFDINADGVQDASESGIPGAPVKLCSQSSCGTGGGNVVYATATTDDNGNYLFSGLTAGTTYYVRVDPNPPTSDYVGVSDRDGGGFSEVHAFTPNASTDLVNLTYDWGYDTDTADAGGVDGYVWNDINADGVIDGGETGYDSVTVELCTGTPGGACASQGTTTTDSNGYYQFANHSAGSTYYVRVSTAPASTSQTYEYNAVCGSCDGDTINFDVTNNAVTHDINLGYRKTGTSTIGDLIFRDWNGNGTQDSGDEGIDGLTVKLYLDNDDDGVVDSGDYLFAQTTTSNGAYLFSNVPAGNYIVVVSPPADHIQTVDPEESGVCSTCDSKSRQQGVDGSNSYLTHDYAYKPSGTASIGDYVWRDMDGDGTQDAGETGIANIQVTLNEDSNNDGAVDSGDAVVASMDTDADGNYLFTGLAAGNYLVDVDTSDGDLPTANGNRYALTTNNDPHDVTLSAGQAYDTADFGFAPTGIIGDYVWQDDDSDGVQDVGESGINGVTVELYNCGPNGTCEDGGGDDVWVGTDTTANDSNGNPGYYEFTNLLTNDYVVLVTGGVPAGYTQTGDPDSPVTPCTDTGGVCNNRSVLENQQGSSPNPPAPGLAAGQVDRSRDFGYKPPISIGDFVWLDANKDGVQDAGESGIGFVTVRLCSDAGCGTVVQTTQTDSDGKYTFGNVADSSTYYVVVDPSTLPTGVVATYEYNNTATPDGNVDVTTSSGAVSNINSTACSNCNMAADFGYYYSGDFLISGQTFHDNNNNGTLDTGDTDYPGVTVYLYVCTPTTPPTCTRISSQSTDVSGNFQFGVPPTPNGLPAGSYRVSTNPVAPGGENITTVSYHSPTLGPSSTGNNFGFYQTPTAVTLAAFTAAPQGNTIVLTWETATELDNLGFNLYRAEAVGGPRSQLNASLIASQNPGSPVGASYEFVDASAAPGLTYYYWLEAVDVYGATQMHGPISAQVVPLRRLLPVRPRLVPSLPVLRNR